MVVPTTCVGLRIDAERSAGSWSAKDSDRYERTVSLRRLSEALGSAILLAMQSVPVTAAPRVPKVRAPRFPFEAAGLRRWWFHKNPLITHTANGLNLLFPAGERYFIRSVRYFAERIEDPELLARVRAFYGQEGRHGHEHDRFNKMLRAQGYDIDSFFRVYERWAFDRIERVTPPNLRLAATAAAEHFTATLAERALTQSFMDGAPEVVQSLMKWHACEEIEHKSVAFDVLKHVDDRYWVRAVGLVLATAQLVGWWMLATRMLVDQEEFTADQLAAHRRDAEEIRQRFGVDNRELFRAAFLDFLRPDFHPDQRDNYHLAYNYLHEAGLL